MVEPSFINWGFKLSLKKISARVRLCRLAWYYVSREGPYLFVRSSPIYFSFLFFFINDTVYSCSKRSRAITTLEKKPIENIVEKGENAGN